MGSYSIRRAVLADAPQVAELVNDAYRPYIERIGRKPGPMTDDYTEIIDTHQVTVAEGDGIIEGLVVLRITDEGFLIDNVAVRPAMRGTGLGRALLELAEAEGRQAGFDSIYLFTHEKMTENQASTRRLATSNTTDVHKETSIWSSCESRWPELHGRHLRRRFLDWPRSHFLLIPRE